MARNILRGSSWQEGNCDRYFDLYMAVVERSWLDLTLPTRYKGGNSNFPTQFEKETAMEFLENMYQAACRRLIE